MIFDVWDNDGATTVLFNDIICVYFLIRPDALLTRVGAGVVESCSFLSLAAAGTTYYALLIRA